MKKIIGIMILCLLITTAVFADGSDDQGFGEILTVKGYVGYNFWYLPSLVGADMFSSDDETKLSFGGFAFGTQVLFLDRAGLQVGLGFAMLPMMSGKVDGAKFGMTLMPLTADLVFNYKKNYTCLGFGMGFINVSGKVENEEGGTSSASFTAEPSVVFKFGQGVNYPITDAIAVDFGVDMYFPFGMRLGEEEFTTMSPIMAAILFSQFTLRIGVSYSL